MSIKKQSNTIAIDTCVSSNMISESRLFGKHSVAENTRKLFRFYFEIYGIFQFG